jgi:hypothetical protein
LGNRDTLPEGNPITRMGERAPPQDGPATIHAAAPIDL